MVPCPENFRFFKVSVRVLFFLHYFTVYLWMSSSTIFRLLVLVFQSTLSTALPLSLLIRCLGGCFWGEVAVSPRYLFNLCIQVEVPVQLLQIRCHESSRSRPARRNSRSWILGSSSISEVDIYHHLGILRSLSPTPADPRLLKDALLAIVLFSV